MAQTRGTFVELYDNIDKTVFTVLNDQLKELKPIWRQYFNVKDSDKKFERVMTVQGMGDIPQKGEGETYQLDVIKAGYTKDFTHVEFGLGFAVTETALEDDQHDQLEKNGSWLAYSARVVEEKRAANVFNNGFGSETTPDGVSLFNATHVLKSGTSARNTLATAADLSATSLAQALVDLQTQTKLESGQVVAPITDLVLLVPPALELTAYRLLESAGLPSSADNDMNPFKKRSWKVVVNPFLTDDDAWFILAASKKLHGITSYTRVPITMVPAMTDPATGNRIYKVRFRRSWGAWQWQNVFGVPGA